MSNKVQDPVRPDNKDLAADDEPSYATTIHVRDHCLCLHAQRAARALGRCFDDVLRPYGLTNGQFSLLMALNRPAPPSMGEVATVLAMDRTTLTAALKPLEREGLVTVLPMPDDRRKRVLSLTDAGRTALARALPAWSETQRRLDGLVADADRLRSELAAVASSAQGLHDDESG